MNNPLLDWNNLQYFVLLVEHETLTAASEALGVQHSTVARRVSELEQRLGILLFDRIGKRYMLTDDGKHVYQYASELAKNIRSLQRFAGQRASLSVQVVVSAPPAIVKAFITPNLDKFYQRHDNIALIIHSSAHMSDLHDRQADIALRMVYPNKPDLMVRRLRTMSFGFFARPDYLKNTSIKNRRYLGLSAKTSLSAWCERVIGEQVLAFACNDFDVIKQAALDGLGMGFLPSVSVMGTSLVATGVDDKSIEMTTLQENIYLVSHQEVRRSAAVGAVVNFLVEIMGE